jgi:PAS domain S-box-containing protein
MANAPDHFLLFRASPYPYLVMANDLTIIDANNAYLRSVGRTKEDIVGRYIFDAFPQNPADPDSTNLQVVKESLETAIATAQPHTTPFLRYAVPKQTPEGTIFAERYWSTVHTPALDDDGKVAFVFQNAIDVTELYRFDKTSQIASVDFQSSPKKPIEHFGHAQMLEAMTRVLNDERGHLRNIFNQAPGFVAILNGPTYVFEMVNDAYYQLVGYRDLVGRPLWEAIPEGQGQGFEEVLDAVYRTGEPYSVRAMPITLQREKDGPMVQRYIDFSYQPFREKDGRIVGIFAQGYDVTDVSEAQASKKESEERLQEGMVAAKMVVWDWEIESRKIVFSDNVIEVLGTTADNIDSLHESIHPDDRAKMRAAHQRAFEEKSGYQEVIRFIRPDTGQMVWNEVRAKVRCDKDGKPFAVRGMTIDVTERLQAEQELREADRRKDEFLAMLAHELRNPLAPISSAAELMKMVKLDEARLKKTSDVILRQVKHMTGLVDDLIDVSRVTRGLVVTEKNLLDMKRIISDAVEQAAPLIEDKRHHVQVNLPGEPVHVTGDQKRLVQVFANILSNAAKYTPPGGNIVLRMEAKAGQVCVTISDDGIGMDIDLVPKVFDLFTQGKRTSDRSQGGLGIGLSLVKNLVELHSGTVAAFSEGPGKGSQFVICLPCESMSDLQSRHSQDGIVMERSENSLYILVVDDNTDAAEMLALNLQAVGHKVNIAASAHAAIEMAKTQVPDIFILDIGLPEMDGNELARQLRSQPETSHTTLIAVTGYSQEQDRRKTESSGFNHHLVKPVDTALLLEIVANRSRK